MPPYREKWVSDCGTVTLYLGDCLDILPTLEPGSVDAVVTDPPYSSGGQFRGDRSRSVVEKYVQTGVAVQRSEFSGDNLDQRAFLIWSRWWLSQCKSCTKTGGVLVSFIDWRQLPTMTDAVQLGGWVWRNVCTWWKPGCRMQRGRFSSSAEFLVYATNGPHESDGESSPQNVIQCATLSGEDKDHIAEKPLPVVLWALSVTRPLATILDPFVGSGTTAEACIATGRRFIGCELDPAVFEVAKERIASALSSAPLLEKPRRLVPQELFGAENP